MEEPHAIGKLQQHVGEAEENIALLLLLVDQLEANSDTPGERVVDEETEEINVLKLQLKQKEIKLQAIGKEMREMKERWEEEKEEIKKKSLQTEQELHRQMKKEKEEIKREYLQREQNLHQQLKKEKEEIKREYLQREQDLHQQLKKANENLKVMEETLDSERQLVTELKEEKKELRMLNAALKEEIRQDVEDKELRRQEAAWKEEMRQDVASFNMRGQPPTRGRGRFGYGGGQESLYGGPDETKQVSIPKDLAGAVIGRGGARIRQIRSESGAGIVIHGYERWSDDRVISITGSPIQIRVAQNLLQQTCWSAAESVSD